MSFLRFGALLALATWTGGLAVLGGLGAPVLFEALEVRDPAGGRETAAMIFGVLFERFQHLAWILGLILLVSLGFRAALGPRPRRFGWRMWIVAAMLATSVVTAEVIAPRIAGIRASVHGPIAALPETDPRRMTFGRLHGLTNGLMLLTILAGIGLLWTEMKDPS